MDGSPLGAIMDVANFGLQLGKTGYDIWRQDETWRREDSAVQRRVADLKAAGLSPVLAVGSAASTSAPINVSAPQVDASNIMRSIEYAQAKKQMALTDANQRLTEAQIDKVDAESFIPRLYRDYLRDDASTPQLNKPSKSKMILDSMATNQIATNIAGARSADEIVRNTDFARSKNLPSNSPEAIDAITTNQIIDSLIPGSGGGKGTALPLIMKIVRMFK